MVLLLPLALLLVPPLGRPPPARAARATVREAPRVRIPDQGVVSGREVFVTRTARARQYLGIPFAWPPVGDLRFAAPATAPPPSWDEPRDSAFQPACMQHRDRFEEHDRLRLEPKLFPDDRIEFSEDCLYLNIFTPEAGAGEGLPVMVWLHSGDFNVGATHLWDFSVFAVKQKVIVVTPAYRLNVFGFLSTQDGAAPGNWGLLDQAAALDWVHQRIATFGGDPERVVLAGHTAGAVSVGLHMVSPMSRGKFGAALQMSGGALSPSAVRVHPSSLVPDMADNFGCDEVMVCLRRISASIMLQQSGSSADWGPVVDGPYANRSSEAFLPAAPRQLLQEGRFAAVPMMAGYADMEEAIEFDRRHPTADSPTGDSPGSTPFDRQAFDTLIGDTALEGNVGDLIVDDCRCWGLGQRRRGRPGGQRDLHAGPAVRPRLGLLLLQLGAGDGWRRRGHGPQAELRLLPDRQEVRLEHVQPVVLREQDEARLPVPVRLPHEDGRRARPARLDDRAPAQRDTLRARHAVLDVHIIADRVEQRRQKGGGRGDGAVGQLHQVVSAGAAGRAQAAEVGAVPAGRARHHGARQGLQHERTGRHQLQIALLLERLLPESRQNRDPVLQRYQRRVAVAVAPRAPPLEPLRPAPTPAPMDDLLVCHPTRGQSVRPFFVNNTSLSWHFQINSTSASNFPPYSK